MSLDASTINLINQIQDTIGGIVAETANNLVSEALNSLGGLATGAVNGIIDQLNASLAGLLGFLSGKRQLADAFGALLDEALGHLTSIATSLLNVGLASVLGALSGKRGVFDDLLAQLSGAVSGVTGTITNVVSSLGQVGGVLLDSVTPHLQDLQDQLTNHALNAAQSLLGTLAGISGTLQGKRQLGDAFGSLLNEALGHLTDIATSLLNVGLASVLGALSGKRQLADAFGSLLNEALGHLTSIATSLLNVGLASVLGSLGSGKRDIWDDLLNVATSVGTTLAQQLLVTALGSLLGKRGVFDDLLASLGGIVNQVTGTVSTVVGSLGQVGGVLLDSVTPHLQDLQDQLTNHALNAAQSLLGTLAGISGTLQG